VGSRAAEDLAAQWAARVRANRDQVERHRQVPETSDFYAPVSNRFVVDPHRTDDPVLDALLRRARPVDTWLDIGAGAGRFALPLALRVARVVAVDPSAAMLQALGEAMETHHILNIEAVERRWPPDGTDAGHAALGGDVALIANVGYDVEPIGEFLDAMEAAAGRLCVAVMTDRAPASYASPFWPIIHGEERAELPALDDLLALLRARGARPSIERIERPPRLLDGEAPLLDLLRHQLWIAAGSEADQRLVEAVRRSVTRTSQGITLEADGGWIGIVDWVPPSREAA
jgi:SAM-dependent methyltransferase